MQTMRRAFSLLLVLVLCAVMLPVQLRAASETDSMGKELTFARGAEDGAPDDETVVTMKVQFIAGFLAADITGAPADAKLIAARFDADGRLSEVKTAVVGEPNEEAGFARVIPFGNEKVEEGRTYKVMLADGTTFAPLCAAWTDSVPVPGDARIFMNLGERTVTFADIDENLAKFAGAGYVKPGEMFFWGSATENLEIHVYKDDAEINTMSRTVSRQVGLGYYLYDDVKTLAGQDLVAGSTYEVTINGVSSGKQVCSERALGLTPQVYINLTDEVMELTDIDESLGTYYNEYLDYYKTEVRLNPGEGITWGWDKDEWNGRQYYVNTFKDGKRIDRFDYYFDEFHDYFDDDAGFVQRFNVSYIAGQDLVAGSEYYVQWGVATSNTAVCTETAAAAHPYPKTGSIRIEAA